MLSITEKMVPCLICFLFTIALLSAVFSGCGSHGNLGKTQGGRVQRFSSYRDIPGVTNEEIAAIEAIRQQGQPLIFGMQLNTEAFLDFDGEIKGFNVLLCEWLTELFGIPFVPRHYAWLDLLSGLESGEIAFTGELTPNEERRKTYFMTGTIAQRSLKYFRLEGSPSFNEIAQTRLPRYTLREGTTVAVDAITHATRQFEPVFIQNYNDVYELLRTGAADALITEGVQEAYWEAYSDVVISDFYPLLYSPVSLSTQTSSLSPIISVFQKALENGAVNYLNELYETGNDDYLKHKLYLQLTPREREYIKQNPVIRLGAEYDSYPVSYFNERYQQWQGIAFDVLGIVSSLTGLEFNPVHGTAVELFHMLETGEVDMITELIRTAERRGYFLWPENSFMTERSVLISRLDYRNVSVYRIYSERVGVCKGTAQAEFFHNWFPNHPNIIEYDDQTELFNALKKNEVDLVMNSYSSLLNLTNYQELPDFKANIVFGN
ncbi:MAG: transporter substrate-binding domain-containing protein, partial [Treponema sp.]|nr:transporter substrate-binding domain-containing protein [Treponema sp.]